MNFMYRDLQRTIIIMPYIQYLKRKSDSFTMIIPHKKDCHICGSLRFFPNIPFECYIYFATTFCIVIQYIIAFPAQCAACVSVINSSNARPYLLSRSISFTDGSVLRDGSILSSISAILTVRAIEFCLARRTKS